MSLEDLVAEYQARGLGREEAVRAIRDDLGELLPKTPLPELPRMRPVLEEFAEGRGAIRATERGRVRPPPTPVEVVERIAEALPQPPVSPPLGTYYARVHPGGAMESMGWRPPGITPVGFHRGYWTGRTNWPGGNVLRLYRSGQAVNEWDVSGEKYTQATRDVTAFVQRWPIQAERSVFTGGRR